MFLIGTQDHVRVSASATACAASKTTAQHAGTIHGRHSHPLQELSAAFTSWRHAVGRRGVKAARQQAALEVWRGCQLSAALSALADNRDAMRSLRKVRCRPFGSYLGIRHRVT